MLEIAIATTLSLISLAGAALFLRSRKRHFIRGLSDEHKQILVAGGVKFEIGNIEPNGAAGVFIKGGSMRKACRALRMYKLTSWKMPRTAVIETVLRPTSRIRAGAQDANIMFINGSRANRKPPASIRKASTALIREVIEPIAGRDIMVHTMRGAAVPPIRDGRFHIFVNGSVRTAATTDLPETVMGVRYKSIAPRQMLYHRGAGRPLIDPVSRVILGEIVDTNCIYLYFNALADKGRKLAQFAALLDVAAAHLTVDTGLDEVVNMVDPNRQAPQAPLPLTLSGFDRRRSQVLERLLQVTIARLGPSEVRMENCLGTLREPATIKSDAIQIYYDTRTQSRTTALPTDVGIPISLGNAEIEAELRGRCLFIYSDILNVCEKANVERLARILVMTQEELSSDGTTDRNTERLIREGMRAVAMCPTGIDKDPHQQFQRAEKTAVAVLDKARGTEREILSLGSAQEVELGREFDRLLSMRKIVDVQVTNSAFVVKTDTIYCTDPRSGLVHEIGKFHIHLNFDGTVQFLNQNSSRGQRFNAPHVNEQGQPCLGNIRSLMPDLIRERQLASAAQVAVRFLESVNVDDVWGKSINQWPVARGVRA